jgi:hypothetical protein
MEDGKSAQQMLVDALSHMREAIELLDRAAAPGQIAANVDLAVNQLEEVLLPMSQTLTQYTASEADCGTIRPS